MRSSDRPCVDVVVPFAGDEKMLDELLERLSHFPLGEGDSLIVAHNHSTRQKTHTARHHPGGGARINIIDAAGPATPAFARNQGAAAGRAEWLVFLDADAIPGADLLERYFVPEPGARTALIGGGVLDEEADPNGAMAPRYAYLSGAMSQDDSFSFGRWAYPKSANLACRRHAFESIGGFSEHIRAGEDADLAYRLKAHGWEIERREAAAVIHLSRRSVGSLLGQRALWGAGAAWLDRAYPGSFPARRRPGLIRWALRSIARGVRDAARARSRDAALLALLEPLEVLAYEFGRSLPNERPLTAEVWWRAARGILGPSGAVRR